MSEENLSHKKRFELSVVIATLGGGTLEATIDKLNEGTTVPHEILICIPQREFANVQQVICDNVKYIESPFRGQVAQRAYAFTLVTQPYVLQMDDDIEVDETCMRTLIDFLDDHPGSSASPGLLDIVTGLPSSHMARPDQSSGALYKLMFRVINGSKGYEPGKISKAGVNMAYDKDAVYPYQVEWLPGGCAMHRKENLIVYNYYPYAGKAFSEDLIHSFLLRKNGIKLYHIPAAKCRLDNSSSKGEGIRSLLKILSAFARVMYYFARLTGSSRIRLTGFFILNYTILIYNKLTKKQR